MTLAPQLRLFLRAADDVSLAGAVVRTTAHEVQRYREGSVAARVDALRAAYPTVLLLLHAVPFAGLADGFARATPAHNWDLNVYGASLPEWIREQQPDADGAELAEVARLDWAMHRTNFAADAPPLDRQALAAVPPERQDQLWLAAHPATALITSNSPIHDLWRHARDETLPVTRGEAQTVLVGRDAGHRVWMRPLAPAEAAFVSSGLAGQAIAESLAHALAVDPDFDLPRCLQRQIDEQTWCGFGFRP